MSERTAIEGELPSSRREFLTAAAIASVSALSTAALSAQDCASQASPAVGSVKALTFDVFGTVVDWRSSIIREGQ
jgi:2-haloacid dehalogenase